MDYFIGADIVFVFVVVVSEWILKKRVPRSGEKTFTL